MSLDKPSLNLSNTEQHIISLRFEDTALEAAFDVDQLDWARRVSRLTVIAAVAAYVLYGLLDIFVVTPELSTTLWIFRGIFALVGAAVIAVSFTRLFAIAHQPIMMLTAAFGYGAMGLTMYLVPPIAYIGYYVALVLVVVFCYLTIGLSFRNALVVGVLGLAAYVYVFCYLKPAPEITIVLAHFYFFFTATVISAAGAFNLEQSRRQLFLREQRVQIENRVNRDLASRDSLTGLANRSAVEEFLEQLINTDEDDADAVYCACVVDLSGFKRINAKLGRARADLLLQQLANVLGAPGEQSEGFGNALLIARLAGDEFLIIERSSPDPTQQALVSAEVQSRVHASVSSVSIDADAIYGLPDHLSPVTATLNFPYVGCTPKDILRRADQELARKKYAGSESLVGFDRRAASLRVAAA
jgi:diguanylate cyclase (GGDEF)-like protein